MTEIKKAKINRRTGIVKIIGGVIVLDHSHRTARERKYWVEQEATEIHMSEDAFGGEFVLDIINL